jgi:hypothetical protein
LYHSFVTIKELGKEAPHDVEKRVWTTVALKIKSIGIVKLDLRLRNKCIWK